MACFLEPRTLSRVGTTPRGQWEVPKDGVERSYLSVLCDSIATAAAEPELGIKSTGRGGRCLGRDWGRVAKLG